MIPDTALSLVLAALFTGMPSIVRYQAAVAHRTRRHRLGSRLTCVDGIAGLDPEAVFSGTAFMEKFKDITEQSFGYSAQDHRTRLLLPDSVANVRDHADQEVARRSTSRCRACGSFINKGKQRCIFRWLDQCVWSARSFVHARAEDCSQVEVWDARQLARNLGWRFWGSEKP